MLKRYLSLVAVVALSSTAQASDSFTKAVSEGDVSGQIRFFYIDRQYSGKKDIHRSAFTGGGHLKYETGSLDGFSSGVAFYTTNNFGLGADNLPGEVLDDSLLRGDSKGYSILGEAYVKYKYKRLMLKLGRQKINTPMAKAHDVRMIPNFYEGYFLTDKDIPSTTLTLAHFTKFAAGTFANVYGGGISSATGGYSYVTGNSDNGKFNNIGEYAIGIKTDGITLAGVKYAGIKNLKLQAWDYYVHDILNAIYLQGDLGFTAGPVKLKVSAQYVKENDVGNGLKEATLGFDEVDSSYAAVKFGAKYGSVSGYVAYSATGSDADNPEGSSIINMWGSTTGFTGGMVSHHEFYSDTKTWKTVLAYNFKKLGLNANASFYYCNFDLGENNGYKPGTAWTAKESGFDIKYYPSSVKNLQLRFRGNFPRDFVPGLDWDEYRLIANYNF